MASPAILLDNQDENHFLSTRQFHSETSNIRLHVHFECSCLTGATYTYILVIRSPERQEAGDVASCISHLLPFVIG